MTSRWKRIAARSMQTSAQGETAKRRNVTMGQAGANDNGVIASPGISAHRPQTSGQVASIVFIGLVMRCMKGGGE